MGPNGPTEVLIHVYESERHFFFSNIKPDRYQISRISKSVGGGTATAPTFRVTRAGRNVNYQLPGRTGIARFSPAAVTSTTVDVAPGSFVYMGAFTAAFDIPSWPGSPITVLSTGGSRTADGERAALEFVRSRFGDSRWSERIRRR